ncbi:hypothetical protein OJ996_16730 [Luteolibacter sp. GHJ8]|uniref:Uncharacterized protein n=1 Tax=Luteolibacter rhizosphaerae TaxID=2989719 RepID=A0ABT3G6M8_9BACT|nr:hypothetical protein [Luteolibacter rhizosphaerae]MCW1915234.1 hypothetical protein [Luteolibacter rhizosphaerae]
MNTITDFEGWLDQVDLGGEGYEDVYSLYRSVTDGGRWGRFECKHTPNDTKWFVTADSVDDHLMLASEKARDYFLAYITKEHCGDMEMESWYYYHHAMSKDD